MKINKILKYALISIIIIVIYLILDFFNIFNLMAKNLNFEALSILVNAIVVLFVFLITYSLVNQKTFEHEDEIKKNKRNLLNILLQESYKSCCDILDILDSDDTLKKYIVPKVNFDSSCDTVTKKLKNQPFLNENYIIELFAYGVADSSITKEYFDIKKAYQQYVDMRITFFDIKQNKATVDQEVLCDLLDTDEKILKNKLESELQKRIFFEKEGEKINE